ncbi:MAG TPA: hypothetical protein VKT27_05240 [Candidatus Binataceae bacterium]|nr:hypothetical protein [Candidatus Binataceae bacterium]
MNTRDLDRLGEEHRAILENLSESLRLIEKSLQDMRRQSLETGQILARLMEARRLALQSDIQISRAGELLVLGSVKKEDAA